jgi:heme exporter protein D
MKWSEFFSMGGYAFYVWGSYAIALVAMGGEVILLRQRKKALQARVNNTSHSSESEQK